MKRRVVGWYRRLFAGARFADFNRLLFECSLSGLGILNYEDDKVSGELNLIERILPRLITSDEPVLLDVGANVGDYTRLLRRRFPRAVIHCFEPHPRNFQRLLETNLPNVRYHNLAVGGEGGVLTLYDRADYDGSGHASLYAEVISEIHKQDLRSVEVAVLTLDEIAIREGFTFIDFLKIDTEGHELSVLSGAAALLARDAIGCVQFEFNEMNVISRSFFRDFRKSMKNHVFYRLLPQGLLKLDDVSIRTELFAYQNILAVPAKKAPLM
jgi:FkbM family methyltransferase